MECNCSAEWPLLAAKDGLLLAGAGGTKGSLATYRDALGLVASLGTDSVAMLLVKHEIYSVIKRDS